MAGILFLRLLAETLGCHWMVTVFVATDCHFTQIYEHQRHGRLRFHKTHEKINLRHPWLNINAITSGRVRLGNSCWSIWAANSEVVMSQIDYIYSPLAFWHVVSSSVRSHQLLSSRDFFVSLLPQSSSNTCSAELVQDGLCSHAFSSICFFSGSHLGFLGPCFCEPEHWTTQFAANKSWRLWKQDSRNPTPRWHEILGSWPCNTSSASIWKQGRRVDT